MTLEELIDKLDSLDNSLTIYAAKSPDWTRAAEADLCPANAVSHGFRLPYFLEVSVAKDVVSAWSFVRGGRIPDLLQKCQAIIYYAENDAFLMPEQE